MNNRLINKILLALVLASTALGAAAISLIEEKDFSLQKTSVKLKISGSSTVYPLWVKAQDKLLTDIKDFSINTEISSTGSGNGVTDAKTGVVDFGNASRDPKSSDSEAGTGWENIRTVKLGIDALSMYIKVPESCSDTTISTTPNHIVRAFTGLTEANLTSLSADSGQFSVSSNGNNVLVTKGTTSITISQKSSTLSTLTTSSCSNDIVLYGRNTTASGTRDGFLKIADKTTDASLTWLDDDIFSEILEARKASNQLDTTNEANSAAVQAVEASNGGASYVSFGFVSDKNQEVGTSKLVVPSINFSGNQVIASTKTILDKTYNWSRNLNTIFDVRNKNFEVMKLVLDYFREGGGRAVIREAGFIPIGISEKTFPYAYTDQELKDSGEAIPWLS